MWSFSCSSRGAPSLNTWCRHDTDKSPFRASGPFQVRFDALNTRIFSRHTRLMQKPRHCETSRNSSDSDRIWYPMSPLPLGVQISMMSCLRHLSDWNMASSIIWSRAWKAKYFSRVRVSMFPSVIREVIDRVDQSNGIISFFNFGAAQTNISKNLAKSLCLRRSIYSVPWGSSTDHLKLSDHSGLMDVAFQLRLAASSSPNRTAVNSSSIRSNQPSL